MAYWCCCLSLASSSYFMIGKPRVTKKLWSQKPKPHVATMVNSLHLNHGFSTGVCPIWILIICYFELCHPPKTPRMMIIPQGAAYMRWLALTIHLRSGCRVRWLWLWRCPSSYQVHNCKLRRWWRQRSTILSFLPDNDISHCTVTRCTNCNNHAPPTHPPKPSP